MLQCTKFASTCCVGARIIRSFDLDQQPMPASQLDSLAFRNALGRFATGIAVVTAIDQDGHPIGLTVNSFSAVSLNPALVLWCLDNGSNNREAFRHASHHAINILAEDQQDI